MRVAVHLNVVATTSSGGPPGVAITPSAIVLGQQVEISVNAIPVGTTKNWLGVALPGGTWSSEMPWVYIPDGASYVSLVTPAKVRTSEVLLYLNNEPDPQKLSARSNSVIVNAPPNQPPVWNTELPAFSQGKVSVIRLRDHVRDEDMASLTIALLSSTGDLAASGIVYDEPSDELRYDGRALGVAAGTTRKVGEITVEATEGAA